MKIVSLSPFGLGHQKPHHYYEMLRVLWENRDNLPYAWRVLNNGVCDGCSLGPRGMRDDTLSGGHVCLTRLRLLRLNTMPAAREDSFADISRLRKLNGVELRKLGRLAYPMIRESGAKGFRRISWDSALDRIAGRIKQTDPHRLAFFTTSRGLTNEVYYAAQKLSRLAGTNNIDNAARLCHAASTVALKQTVGVGASTVSYSDWIGTDLFVALGTNIANNQPVAMKYLYHAKKAGTRIAVINPYREPGMDRYWIPSIPISALFGTRFTDEFFRVGLGGDAAFLNGALKYLIEWNALDRKFIDEHTQGWVETVRALNEQQWPDLEAAAGTTRPEMARFAKLYAGVNTAVFCWSMGLTQHPHGVDNVKSVVNLALARGMIGREKAGLVPIRGHSGVQGGGECGCAPDVLPGGVPLNAENAALFSRFWGTEIPTWKGMHCGQMLEAAVDGNLDVFYVIGGNFIETMPEPLRMGEALRKVGLRVHQDIHFNTSMLPDSAEATILLPAKTRYEQEGGGTQTSTERRIRYSPHVPGQVIGEARAEWGMLVDLGRRLGLNMGCETAQEIREEMDRTMPLYRGVVKLTAQGQSFQYGGARLLEGGICPNMPDGKARFAPVVPPNLTKPEGTFSLATRRGTQFNSIILKEHDALTGSTRDELFMNADDAIALDLAHGDAVMVTSDLGSMRATVRIEDVQRGTVQAHWPEANVLITRHYQDQCGVPDYNALVRIKRIFETVA